MPCYFENLSVGDTFETSGYTVTEDEIITFAEQFDPQPFHIDPTAAEDSIFGGLIASGLHTLCLSVRLFVTDFVQGEESLANMGGLGIDSLQWHEPVYPGDTLRLKIRVADKRPSESRPDRGYVDFERTVHVDDEKVLSFISHNIIRRADSDE